MTSISKNRTNALDKLDNNVPTAFIWRLTLLATLGGFLFGYDTSNIGAALTFIPYQLNSFGEGYLVAGASLGAAAGALLAGPLTDRFGRKKLLIADALIYAIGALLSAFTWHVSVLMFARTLIGLAIGADSAIATAYIAEYAPAKRRGALSMLQQWMITVGILISYVVALVILKVFPGSSGSRLALVLRARRGAGDRRADPARGHARVAALADPQGPLRRGAGRLRQAQRGRVGRGRRVHRARARTGGRQERAGRHQGLDAGRAPRALHRLHLLRVPADHRHQRAALLRAEADGVLLPERQSASSTRRPPVSR